MNANITKTAIVVVLLNAALMGGWWYTFKWVRDAKTAAVASAEVIATSEAKQNNIRALGAFLQDIESDRAKIEGAFINSKTLVSFIEEIERLATQANVGLVIELVTLPRSSDGFPVFHLKTDGSFNGTYRFLALLEALRYHVSLTNVQMFENSVQKTWSSAIQLELLSYSN